MTAEDRSVNTGEGARGDTSAYSRVRDALQRDRKILFGRFEESGGGTNMVTLDESLVELYELQPEELPSLVLSNNFQFVEGFSYVVGHWYPIVRAVGSGIATPASQHFMDQHLERMFPDAKVTTEGVRTALSEDPSGARWLEEMAKIEFRERSLALIGARKAITGARKMYEQLAPAA